MPRFQFFYATENRLVVYIQYLDKSIEKMVYYRTMRDGAKCVLSESGV